MRCSPIRLSRRSWATRSSHAGFSSSSTRSSLPTSTSSLLPLRGDLRRVYQSMKGGGLVQPPFPSTVGADLSFKSMVSRPRIVVVAGLLVLSAACTRGPDPEQVVDGVLTTAPFDGAFAVIVPKILPAPCDKLPANDQGKAWTLLVSAGFMMTESAKASNGAPVCKLLLTDRGANRKRFGRIVPLDNA